MDPNVIFERVRTASTVDIEALIIEILGSKDSDALEAALNGLIHQSKHYLARHLVDKFLALWHHVHVALERSELPLANADDRLTTILWQLEGIRRVCQATQSVNFDPEIDNYVQNKTWAIPLLDFMAEVSRTYTEISHFLGEQTGKNVNSNTVKQRLNKLSSFGLIHQPYKGARYDITFRGRQLLTQFDAIST